MVYVYSIHFLCEPLKVRHLPYPFPRANVAKIIRCVSFAKDNGPRVVLFILKGPLSLSLLFICKGPLSCLVLLFAKDRRPCLRLPTCKGRRPCLMLFICKGPRYLFCAISLQRKLLFLLSTCCPGKIRWTAALAKHGETAYPSGLVQTAVSQIST